jgi:hypothetical protein
MKVTTAGLYLAGEGDLLPRYQRQTIPTCISISNASVSASFVIEMTVGTMTHHTDNKN